MTKKAHITNRKTITSIAYDCDGAYRETWEYGDLQCPHCNDIRRVKTYYLGHGDGDICPKCSKEYEIVNPANR